MEQIKLNTIPSGVPSVCHISQFDNTSRIIRCHLFNGSDPLALTGSETIKLFMRKSNNSRAEFEIESTSGAFIDLVITSEMSDIAGDSECKFQITDSEKTIGTLNFKMVVEPDAYGDSLKTRSVSGPIATFETDLAEDLIKLDVDLEPIQDLHGYDNPWPAGGGKNIACLSEDTVYDLRKITAQYIDNNNVVLSVAGTYSLGIYKIPCTIGKTYTVSFRGICTANYKRVYISKNDNVSGSGNYYGILYLSATEELYRTLTFTAEADNIYIGFYIGTSGDPGTATINDFMIEEGSTATSFAPYENVCPITGRTEAKIIHAGKNLLDTRQESIPQYSGGSGVYANVTYTPNNDGSITINGTSTGASVLFFDPVTLNPLTSYPFPTWKYTNNRYTFSVTGGWGSVTGDAYIQATVKKIKDDSIVSRQRLTSSAFSRSFTVREDEYIADAFIRLSSGASASNINIKIQLELGSEVTDYEPYTGTEVTVQFGQTIYKGVLDAKNSKVIATHVCETYDGSSDEEWVRHSATSVRYGFRIYFQHDKKATAQAIDEMLSSVIPLRKSSETASVDDDIITCRSTTYLHKIFYIFTPPSKISTVEELRAFLANEPETVMYPLNEPIEIPLSAISPIPALVGTNNVYSDAGDVDVEYYTTLEGGND